MFVPTFGEHERYRAELDMGTEAWDMNMKEHMTCLGFEAAPVARGGQWDAVEAKVERRMEDMLFPLSVAARVLMYNSHIYPLLKYKSQLAAPSARVLRIAQEVLATHRESATAVLAIRFLAQRTPR